MLDKCRMLWELMRGQRLRYFAAIGVMVLATLLAYLVPLISRSAIDFIIAGKPLDAPAFIHNWVADLGGRSVLARNLWIAGLAVVLLTSASGLFNYWKGKWNAHASEAIAQRIRNRLYDHLQRLPVSYFDKAETGDLVQRCTSDVETIRLFLSVQVVEIGRAIIMLLTVLPIMLLLSVKMTLVSLSLIPIIVAFAAVFFVKIKSAFKLADEAEGKMTTVLQENLTGIRVVRAFARQDYECEKFASRNARFRDRSYRLIRFLSWYWSASDLMCIVQRGLLLAAGAYWILAGQVTVGTLVAFLAYLDMLLWPIRQMGRVLTDLGKAVVSLGRLQDILHQPQESEPGQAQAPPVAVGQPALGVLPGANGHATTQPPAHVRGEIAVRHLTFAFAPGTPVLKDISFDVHPGQTLAILGASGSGKSSLVYLLLRMYDYQSGSIALDGLEISQFHRQYVRRQMGVVLQEPFLYSKSLRENIKLSRPAANEDEIIQATSAASMHETIQAFEKGYDTLVGERGVTLSGGQRQRVALARAILANPPILILDDALSAVDTRTESLILGALRRRHGKRTTLVIAHRLSTLMRADKIIVLDHGQIVQTGTHQTLLQQEGLYRRLWQIQSSLEEDLHRDLGTSTAM